MAKKYITQGYDDCDDCQWIADETDGDILICNDCEHDMQHEQMERTKKEV